MSQGEIIIYKTNQLSSQIDVLIEDETVWLTQAQMTELFNASKQNISLHIQHIFNEKELFYESTVKENLTVQIEGKRTVKRKVLRYNLDVIISVGYRVKSKTGTQFRIWANTILKQYLLKGHAINHRIEHLEQKVLNLETKNKEFDMILHTNLPPNEGIFYDGQIFDAYQFVADKIKSATNSIILIDNYIDETVLTILSKRKKNTKAIIYTTKITQQLKLDIEKYNAQYPPIELHIFQKSHDRFLIIDHQIVYHIGASLKDLGKKWFAFSKINLNAKEMILKLNSL